VVVGNPDLPSDLGSVLGRFFSLGSLFAWKVVAFFFAWAFFSLKESILRNFISAEKVFGQLCIFCIMDKMSSKICRKIFDDNDGRNSWMCQRQKALKSNRATTP
jgi:hypothetical protein